MAVKLALVSAGAVDGLLLASELDEIPAHASLASDLALSLSPHAAKATEDNRRPTVSTAPTRRRSMNTTIVRRRSGDSVAGSDFIRSRGGAADHT
jgi:hypothetical protein